jgi:flagellar hook assembly protein FlgD
MPLTLYQNHPNPFNPSTLFRYYVPEHRTIRLAVYDVSGNLVRVLHAGSRGKGLHTCEWDGRDRNGVPASSGVYFCRLEGGKESVSRTIVLLK